MRLTTTKMKIFPIHFVQTDKRTIKIQFVYILIHVGQLVRQNKLVKTKMESFTKIIKMFKNKSGVWPKIDLKKVRI